MNLIKNIYNSCNEKFSKKVTNGKRNKAKYNLLANFCKNKERCFIIGNGPSLNKEDLKLLENEITFVSNRFFNFYTDWLPTVYFCQDPTVLKNNVAEINAYKPKFKLINPNLKIRKKLVGWDDTVFYHVIRSLYLRGQDPQISEDFFKGLYEGYSVTYSMLQTAIILGFKEIYLLGVDFNYLIVDGKIDESSYPEGMNRTGGGGLPDIEYNYKAFVKFNSYCKERNIKIVNVTRSTKLDAFERDKLENILYGEN